MDEQKVISGLIHSGPGSGFFGGHILDRRCHEMSQVTVSCAPPDIPELRTDVVTLLRDAFGPDRHNTWPLANVCLRRWDSAVSEYDAGRDCLSRYVAKLPQTNKQVPLFLLAVGHFEHSVIDTYLAVLAFAAIVRQLRDDKWKAFQAGDGSTVDRLNRLYNVVKHFDDRFEMGQEHGFPSAYPSPLWITDRGLKGRTTLVDGEEWRRRKTKSGANLEHQDVEVTFHEFVILLSELTPVWTS